MSTIHHAIFKCGHDDYINTIWSIRKTSAAYHDEQLSRRRAKKRLCGRCDFYQWVNEGIARARETQNANPGVIHENSDAGGDRGD